MKKSRGQDQCGTHTRVAQDAKIVTNIALRSSQRRDICAAHFRA
jgi:hypothetical protein